MPEVETWHVGAVLDEDDAHVYFIRKNK